MQPTAFTLPEDDSDMKIVPADPPQKAEPGEELTRALSDMRRASATGLLQKAVQAGEQMAEFAASLQTGGMAAEVLRQRCWLCTLAVTLACEQAEADALPAREMLRAYHERFRLLCPAAYEHTGYSAALTFYHLALRSPEGLPAAVGRTFAMLCGDEANEKLQQLGSETFAACCDKLRQLCRPLWPQQGEGQA